jgi:endo-1,4-beta-xylanase
VTYYKGECYAWDVVNEAHNEDGTLRDDIWLQTLGPDYIATAFKLAYKYDKNVRLYYNDYNIETVNNKSLAVAAMVKDFIKRGIPIDGVGLQSHFVAGQSPTYEQLTTNMRQFTKLGVEVAITELDVRMYFPENPANDTLQAKDYATTTKACLDVDDCVGITVWDFYDPYTWILVSSS